MSEESGKDFFEWKDEIESKYNDLSESRIKCENKIESLKKKQKHDFNKLLWIKMIPYKEWFWNLKYSVDKQISELKEKIRLALENDDEQDDVLEALEKKVNEINSGCGKFEMDYVKQIAELKAIEKVTLDTIEVISKDYKDIKEVLREQYKFRIKWSEKAIFVDGAERLSLDQVKHLEDQIRFYGVLLEKLDSKTEKKGLLCDDCDRKDTCLIDDDYRRACKIGDYQYYRKIKLDLGGEKSDLVDDGVQLSQESRISHTNDDSKLPEPKWCDTCEERLQCSFYTAGEKCTKPKSEPEKYENGEEWECPICKKVVFVGYTVHRHCFDGFNNKLIEEFIKDFTWYICLKYKYENYNATYHPNLLGVYEKWMYKKWQGRINFIKIQEKDKMEETLD